jgi:hypothetical protein
MLTRLAAVHRRRGVYRLPLRSGALVDLLAHQDPVGVLGPSGQSNLSVRRIRPVLEVLDGGLACHACRDFSRLSIVDRGATLVGV